MEAGGAVRSIDGVARRGLTGTEGVVVVGLCHRGGWPASASGSGICVVGAEEGSGADNSGSRRRRRGSLLVRTKGGERIEVEAVAALSRTTTVIIWGAGEAGFSSMKRSWGKKKVISPSNYGPVLLQFLCSMRSCIN